MLALEVNELWVLSWGPGSWARPGQRWPPSLCFSARRHSRAPLGSRSCPAGALRSAAPPPAHALPYHRSWEAFRLIPLQLWKVDNQNSLMTSSIKLKKTKALVGSRLNFMCYPFTPGLEIKADFCGHFNVKGLRGSGYVIEIHTDRSCI